MKPVVARAIGLSFAVAMLVLAGYPQVIHGVVLLALCSLAAMPFSAEGRLLWGRHRWSYLKTGSLAVALCAGMSAVQLLPLLELVDLSHRRDGTGLIFQKDVVYYVRGMLFALNERNQVPAAGSMLVCVLACAIVAVRSTWRAKGYLIGTVLLMVLGMGDVTWFFHQVYGLHLVPGLHYFRIMQIYLAVGTVGLVVLAAFAIDGMAYWFSGYRDQQARGRQRAACAGVLALVCAWFAAAFWAGSGRHLWFSIIFVVAAALAMFTLTAVRRARMIPAAMLALFLLYCGCFQVRHLEFYDASLLTPPSALDHLPRLEAGGGRIFSVSMAGIYGLLDSRWPGLGRMAQRAMASDVGLSNLMRGDSSLDGALALQLYNRDILSQPMKEEALGTSQTAPGARLIDLLDVRFIVSDEELHTSGFSVAAHDPLGFWVMTNTLAQPFVQIYPAAVVARSADESLAMLKSMRTPTLVVQGDTGSLPASDRTAPGKNSAAHVELLQSASNRYVMDVRATTACWLFLADANYPGWHAEVDGASARIWTAQVLGKAVHLDAGSHRVVIEFSSGSFQAGLVVTLISLLAALAILAASRARHRGHRGTGIA